MEAYILSQIQLEQGEWMPILGQIQSDHGTWRARPRPILGLIQPDQGVWVQIFG